EFSALSARRRVDCRLVEFIGNLVCLEHTLTCSNRRTIRHVPFFIFQANVGTHSKNLYGFSKRRVLNLHQEFNSIARFLATKAMIEPFGGCHMERRRAFIMKWA